MDISISLSFTCIPEKWCRTKTDLYKHFSDNGCYPKCSQALKYSQQLLVEDTNDSWALQAVGGSAALALLEAVRQSLDLMPFTKIL